MQKNAENQEKKIDWTKLYGASLAQKDRDALGMNVEMKIYVQDPFIADKYEESRKLGIQKIVVNREPGLSDGPTSSRIVVVDYNHDTNTVAKPVEWDVQAKKFVGTDDLHSVFFHQANVWAIIQNIMSLFEDPTVMGRPIPWAFDGNRLIVLPHAGMRINTSYNRMGKCLVLGYIIRNGVPVYDCLSHDVIAHEIGHAILDGIRPYYYNSISLQTKAFHEFIADFTSILSVLIVRLVRRAVAETSHGNLKNAKVISQLAEEKGAEENAIKQYVRNASNETRMEHVENSPNHYYWSEVLTGAMFEILAKISNLRMEKQKDTPEQALHATQNLNRIAFRALDYCPPVDIQFADYVDALIRANEIAYPADTLGYREIIQTTFSERGIKQIDRPELPNPADLIWKFGLNSIATSRTAAYHFLNDNRDCLDIPTNQDFKIADLYYTNKKSGPNRKLPREIILEYVWEEAIALEGSDFGKLKDKVVSLLCGGTLIFDEVGNFLYRSRKAGTQLTTIEEEGKERVKKMLDYIKMLVEYLGEYSAEKVLNGVSPSKLAFTESQKVSPYSECTLDSGSAIAGQQVFYDLVPQTQRIVTPRNISSLEFEQLLEHLKSVSRNP